MYENKYKFQLGRIMLAMLVLASGLATAERASTGGRNVSYTFVAAPGESAFDLCDSIVLTWGVPQEVLDNKFSNRMCSSGNSSSDFPAFPALGSMRYPWGSGDDYLELRSIKVYSSPTASDSSECGFANPILPSTGTKFQTEIDYIGAGSLPLQIVRTYSSANPLGYDQSYWNWSIGNTMQLDPEQGEGRVIAYYPDRRFVHFRLQSDGSWNALGGSSISLSKVGDFWVLNNFDADRTETFDAAGRLTAVSKNGRSLSYSYDTVNGEDRTIVSDAFGKQIEVFFNDDDDPSRVVDPAGNIIWYNYAGVTGPYEDNLTSVVYGDNSAVAPSNSPTRLYHYEHNTYPSQYAKKMLTGITDERGVRYVTWEYARAAENSPSTNYFYAKSSEHAGVDKFELNPISGGNATEVTNPLGKKTILHYGTVNGVRKLTEVEGVASANCVATTQSKQYDNAGFVSQKVDQKGNITNYVRNDRGLAESTTVAAGTADGRTTSIQWHTDYRLPEVITEPGRTTTYTYSPYSNPNYTQMSVTDTATSAVRTWAYTYNTLGQPLTIDGPRTGVNDVTTYTYHDCTTGGQCGQVATMVNALGQTTTYSSYNAHGQPTQITDSNGQLITLEYNLRQWMTKMTVAGSSNHGYL